MLFRSSFQTFEFTSQQRRYMLNFNVRYECLDAQDSYRAQMKSSDSIVGSWDDKKDEFDDELHGASPPDIEPDDTPFNPLTSGPIHKRHTQDMNNVKHMMSMMGWTDPLNPDRVSPGLISFKPDVFKPGSAWEQDIETMKQTIFNEKITNRLNAGKENNQEQSFNKEHIPNIIKVVDKSYLEKNFRKSGASELVDLIVKDYTLNREQERVLHYFKSCHQ